MNEANEKNQIRIISHIITEMIIQMKNMVSEYRVDTDFLTVQENGENQ